MNECTVLVFLSREKCLEDLFGVLQNSFQHARQLSEICIKNLMYISCDNNSLETLSEQPVKKSYAV